MQHETDFDAVYQGRESAQNVPWVPWNIGEPQPKLAELEPQGVFRSDVLDAGCGVGVTSLFLARMGYTVVGLDSAPSAIAAAQQATEGDGLPVTFDVADLTTLQGYEGASARSSTRGRYRPSRTTSARTTWRASPAPPPTTRRSRSSRSPGMRGR